MMEFFLCISLQQPLQPEPGLAAALGQRGTGGASRGGTTRAGGSTTRQAPPLTPSKALSARALALQKELSLPYGSPVTLTTNNVSIRPPFAWCPLFIHHCRARCLMYMTYSSSSPSLFLQTLLEWPLAGRGSPPKILPEAVEWVKTVRELSDVFLINEVETDVAQNQVLAALKANGLVRAAGEAGHGVAEHVSTCSSPEERSDV